MIIVTEDNTDSLIMAEICPTKEKPVRFKMHIEKGWIRICLVIAYEHYGTDYTNIPRCDKGGEGFIMLNDNDQLITNICSMEQ